MNRTTPHHEAISADHCGAQRLYTVSLTPTHWSQRSNAYCPSPAAEQSCPLLPNVHGQGSLGTTNLERNAHKCGKENTTHSHEGPSYRKPSDLKPSWIFLSFLRWGRAAMLAAGPYWWSCWKVKVCPSPLASFDPSFSIQPESARIWFGEADTASPTRARLLDRNRAGANPNLKQRARK